MPPPNTSFATAIDLGVLPATINIDVHDSGVNYTVYYKFTAPAGASVIGAWGFSPIAETYRASIKPYDGPVGSPVQILSISASNVPIQFPVIPGNEYFLEFTKNGDTSPADIAINVQVAPSNIASSGNILVNDDSDGFPLAILSSVQNYTAINYINNIVAGEAGDIISNGIFLLEDRFDNASAHLYNSGFSQISVINYNVSSIAIRACRSKNKFYVITSDSPSQYNTIDAAGNFTSLIDLTGFSFITTVSVNDDETILYFADSNSSYSIRRWDIVNGVALSDLAPAIANYYVGDLLALADNSIVALYHRLADGDVFANRYDPSGTILNTYTIGSHTPVSFPPRLATALDDATSFWVWTNLGTGDNIFRNVRTSDGTVLSSITHQIYQDGHYDSSETANPTTRFGNSSSCPFMIFTAPAPKGLFKIVPDKRTDHDGTETVAIPDPTFKTGLLP